jgi:hypothetical protein
MKLLKVKIGDAEVANQAGIYKKFFGTIDWKGNKGEVQNADFELTPDGKINWDGGVWENGTWHKGHWKNGTWQNGWWQNGTWQNGWWKQGTWKNGVWYDGVWYDGVWQKGTWKNGVWLKGYIGTQESKRLDPNRFAIRMAKKERKGNRIK